jgi:hypothetical protein
MKAIFVLMFSIFLINRSLSGQTGELNFTDRDIKQEFFNNTRLGCTQVKRPDFNLPGKFDSPVALNFNRDNFYKDSSIINNDTLRPNRDFVVIEEYPKESEYYNDPFVIRPGSYGKLIIKVPDKTVRYYLIIKNPYHFPINK